MHWRASPETFLFPPGQYASPRHSQSLCNGCIQVKNPLILGWCYSLNQVFTIFPSRHNRARAVWEYTTTCPFHGEKLSFSTSLPALVIEKTPDCIWILFPSKYQWTKNILLLSNRESRRAVLAAALWRGEGIHLLGPDDTVPCWAARSSYISQHSTQHLEEWHWCDNTLTDNSGLWGDTVDTCADQRCERGGGAHGERLPCCRWGLWTGWTGLWSDLPLLHHRHHHLKPLCLDLAEVNWLLDPSSGKRQ